MTKLMTHPDLPPEALNLEDWKQDRILERIAMRREQNRIPDADPTPKRIVQDALGEVGE